MTPSRGCGMCLRSGTPWCRNRQTRTGIDIRDGLAQGIADGSQRGRDGLRALVQRIALARLLVRIAPLLLQVRMC